MAEEIKKVDFLTPHDPKDLNEAAMHAEIRRITQLTGSNINVILSNLSYLQKIVGDIEGVTLEVEKLTTYPQTEIVKHGEDFTSQTSLSIEHNLDTRNVFIQIWMDDGGTLKLVDANSIQAVSPKVVEVTFGSAISGRAVMAAPNVQSLIKRVTKILHSAEDTDWSIKHSLDSEKLFVQCWQDEDYLFSPDSITISDKDNIAVVNGSAVGGRTSILGLNPRAGVDCFSKDFTSETSVTLTHNRNTQDLLVQVWKDGTTLVDADEIVQNSRDEIEVTFGSAISGRVVGIPLT